jgi:hypothetical protein
VTLPDLVEDLVVGRSGQAGHVAVLLGEEVLDPPRAGE